MEAIGRVAAMVFGDHHKDTVLSLLGVVAAVVVFATANNWINFFAGERGGTTEKRTKPNPSPPPPPTGSGRRSGGNPPLRRRNGTGRLLLGAAAFLLPRIYQTACSSPGFVDGLDRVLDGFQARLREAVASTATTMDDALLDSIDGVLDGIQLRVRRELRAVMELEAERAAAEDERGTT